MDLVKTNEYTFHGHPGLNRDVTIALNNTTAACNAVATGRSRMEPLREKADHAAHELAVAGRSGGWIHHLFVALALIAAGCIEVVLSSSAYQELAATYLGLSDSASWYLGVVMPFAVLLLELAAARFIYQHELNHTPGQPVRTIWHRIRTAMLIFIVAIALSARLTRLPEGDPADLLAFWLLTFGACVLSLIVHGLVLHSGRYLDEAQTFFLATMEHRSAASTQRGNLQWIRDNEQMAREGFGLYCRRLEEYSRMFPNFPIEPGPFDATTQLILNELHNATLISEPRPTTLDASSPPITPADPPVGALPGPATPPGLPAPPPVASSSDCGSGQGTGATLRRSRQNPRAPRKHACKAVAPMRV
jgi:hypothetical protein